MHHLGVGCLVLLFSGLEFLGFVEGHVSGQPLAGAKYAQNHCLVERRYLGCGSCGAKSL